MNRDRFASQIAAASVVAALIALAGFSGDNPVAPAGSFRDPVQLVDEHAAAIRAMDADRYAALLEAPSAERSAGFRYYPPESDLADLPWMTDTSWGHDDELAMVRRLLDPAFASPEAHRPATRDWPDPPFGAGPPVRARPPIRCYIGPGSPEPSPGPRGAQRKA